MVGLTGNNYLFIFSCHVDMHQLTVMAVPGGFKLPTQTKGATKEARNWVKMPKAPQRQRLVMIVWT
jgi:hypothetical protein